MIQSFFTGKGDDGTSGLFKISQRLPKNNPIFDLLGTLDELNSWLGLCKTYCQSLKSSNQKLIQIILEQTQEHIFIIQAEIAGSKKALTHSDLEIIERLIHEIGQSLTPAQSFFLPGGCVLSSYLDITRTIARRCERIFIKAHEVHNFSNYTVLTAYLNRLSSLLYVLVRYINQIEVITEKSPTYNS